MRKSIHLTGRKQLPQSYFTVTLIGEAPDRAARLDIGNDWNRSAFPANAEISVKLVENKFVEVLRFGPISEPNHVLPIANTSFRAPSCQIRIVNRDGMSGLLLASTKAWTLRSAGTPEGILDFQPADIQPLLWKLDIRPQGNPLLYIDERVPNAAHWAKTDPVFAACVLPQAVAEIFRAVLDGDEAPEGGWEADWIRWAQDLVPGSVPPFGTEDEDKKTWIENLVDAFAKRHSLAQSVIMKLEDQAS